MIFTADADDAEQVLSDKTAFPTRGHTGFNELVGEGLLGSVQAKRGEIRGGGLTRNGKKYRMISGPKHTAHRRLVTKFLSENHLSAFIVVVLN